MENLTTKQRKAIECLLTRGDTTSAATEAGISRQTLYLWLKQDDFKKALEAGTAEALESLSRALIGLGGKAASTLDDILSDRTTPYSASLRAVEIVIGNILRLRELITLEQRVSVLERLNNDHKKQG
jgi:hypothetical protein